jgi:hypothetical protein
VRGLDKAHVAHQDRALGRVYIGKNREKWVKNGGKWWKMVEIGWEMEINRRKMVEIGRKMEKNGGNWWKLEKIGENWVKNGEN